MAESYLEDYQDALLTMQEDGFPVRLIRKGVEGNPWELDDQGNPVESVPDVFFDGFGITTSFSSYYIANGIAKAGDTQLIFVPADLSDEYLEFYALLSGGDEDKAYAEVDGEQWRIIGGEQVKPTSNQILAKLQLRK